MREIVIDRAMAAPGDPVSLDDLKIIVLMVYWSFGEEPDALVLDELCDAGRRAVWPIDAGSASQPRPRRGLLGCAVTAAAVPDWRRAWPARRAWRAP